MLLKDVVATLADTLLIQAMLVGVVVTMTEDWLPFLENIFLLLR